MVTESAIGVLVPMFFVLFFLVLITLIIGGFAFWIWMLVDCVKRKFKNENDKILWVLLIVLLGWLGALVYFFVVRMPEKKKLKKV